MPDASGCFSTSYHQQSLVGKKRNDKVKTLENLSLFVTRQHMQVAMPNWVGCTRGVRDAIFCLTITSNSWLVKVSQYDINVSVFLVGVASCVCAGGAWALWSCCSFFCVFPFFGVLFVFFLFILSFSCFFCFVFFFLFPFFSFFPIFCHFLHF